jgi:dephospho-CoA kinase
MNSPNESRFVVGLTGGIASGKSTIADCFADLGVAIIDTDVIAREIVSPGSAALEEIRVKFGDEVIGQDGSLDREVMRKIVFSDESERQRLEAILHPRIRDEAYQQATAADGPYVIIVGPLLYESPMKDAMDRILVVDCREETQLQRLMERDGETREQACRIMATQASREERLSIADDVILNDGDRSVSEQAAQRLHETYLVMAQRKSA